MKTTTRISAKEQSHEAQRILSRYIRAAKHYRTTWGYPPDKRAFMSLWAEAREMHNPAQPTELQVQHTLKF